MLPGSRWPGARRGAGRGWMMGGGRTAILALALLSVLGLLDPAQAKFKCDVPSKCTGRRGLRGRDGRGGGTSQSAHPLGQGLLMHR